jgi:hypothetical protein
MCFSTIYPLTAEIYPTDLRTIGTGLASAFGRISTILLPFFLIE